MRLASLMSGLVAAALVIAPLAAPAAPMSGMSMAGNSPLLKVQHRPHGSYRGSYHGHRGGGDGGAAAAGALFGFFMGSMIAAGEAQRQQAIAWCAQHYRSYDPYSMTFMGYDGRRHPCP